jgi:6,7-dimethyl-8-ribityllumazine synthase
MSEGYDRPRWDDDEDDAPASGHSLHGDEHAPAALAADEGDEGDDGIERSSENVLESWPEPVAELPSSEDVLPSEEEPEPELVELPADEPSIRPLEPRDEPVAASSEHAPGELTIPPGYPVLEGVPRGDRRAVGVVVGRFNGEVTTRLLDSALAELSACGVAPEAITVMPVPGAFELPLAAMALAKTRRFACIVALGCVIRGDTPHFDYVASEAASGLQLAAIETGVPVAFGVLTLDRADQAEARVDKGAEAVRTALEMADTFSNLRAAASR